MKRKKNNSEGCKNQKGIDKIFCDYIDAVNTINEKNRGNNL